jgi:NAD(P)-dependent dehydrogenase (short-subunit alcohol dehydrogenase family)
VVPLLRKSRAGRIVNLTSDLGSLAKASSDPAPQLLAYNSSKAALNAVTVTYSKRVARSEHPGQRRLTRLSRHRPERTPWSPHPDQGAKLPIRMATLPTGGPTGIAVTADTDLTQHPLSW